MTSHVLCVGLTCLDLVQVVDEYPVEDSDQRSTGARWQRGGNASNNCTVLSQLGITCAYLGTLAQDLTSKFIEEDFRELNIDTSKCKTVSGTVTPISTVILTKVSRTIIHHPGNLPEMAREHFLNEVDFSHYKWVHFEGRNVKNVAEALRYIDTLGCDRRPKVSVELEKARDSLNELIPLADVVFLSKDYSRFRGWESAQDAVVSAPCRPQATVVCAWGESGAWAKTCDGQVHHSPAYPPPEIVDTLGAGDTFVAGYLASQCHGLSVDKSLEAACRLAGAKIGLHGLKSLSALWPQILNKVE